MRGSGLTPQPQAFCSLRMSQHLDSHHRGFRVDVTVLSPVREHPHVRVADVIVGRVGRELHLSYSVAESHFSL